MINSIKMRSCATYDDINGAAIENCKKINFIYGSNGSGKSTISNYLQDLTDFSYSDCSLEWSAGMPTDIVVYNRKFREKNFNGNLAGIFTLGEAAIEDIKHLDELKKQREDKKSELVGHKESLKRKNEEKLSHDNSFRETIWNVILKQNESDFQDAFSGCRSSKDKFKDQILERFNKNHSSTETKEKLKARAATLFMTKPEICQPILFEIESIEKSIYEIENDSIWQKIVVGNKDIPLAKLIEHLNNADWVNRGRSYLKGSDTCPFCQQKTITSDFTNQLSAFFSGEYAEDVENIQSQISKYKHLTDSLVNILRNVITDKATISVGALDLESYNTKTDLVVTLFAANLSGTTTKEKEPSQRLELNNSKKAVDELKEMILTANQKIAAHNQMVEHYNTERTKLSDDIWTFFLDEQEALISGYLSDLSNFDKAFKGIQQKINELEVEIKKLNDEVIEAGKNITSVQPTVDEINRSLLAYGFNNFKIVASTVNENSYQIQRPDGSLATDTLSEGEETFISFLYFLQLAKGATDISKISSKKILVIDDPICSLDSTILYIVSAMVKDLINSVKEGVSDVEQIFILTHNVFFHKEASFIDGRTSIDAKVAYWVIHKDVNISRIKSYETTNPIRTSYELLWQELKDNTSGSLVTTQNIMRRIIESYFGMLGNKKYDYVENHFQTVEEQIICKSLFYWINDGSHTIPDDLYIDSYSDSIDKYKEVFRQIFIATNHEAHYNMMMRIES